MSRPRARSVASKQGYHHQHLRRALLDAAINHLTRGEVTTLTIQVLARAAKVSPGAPYHHFADKLELLAALAAEAWEHWSLRSTAAVSVTHEPRAQLLALAREWLAFAAAHPAYYRVMLLPDLGDRVRFAAMHAASGKALVAMTDIIARGVPHESGDQVAARAVVAFSTLHGFAVLRSGGVLTNIPSLPGLAELEESAAQLTALTVLGPATTKAKAVARRK